LTRKSSPRIDTVGNWTIDKLTFFRNYAEAFSTALQGKFRLLYVDAFAGAGEHICKATLELLPGSPRNALSVRHPFDEYHFIEKCEDRACLLEGLRTSASSSIEVHHGDCNDVLRNSIIPYIARDEHIRALCMLDPYSLNYDWDVVCGLAATKKVDLFLNFMIMDANMNALKTDPNKVDPEQAERLTRVWGSDSWRQVAYIETIDLFGQSGETKRGNQAVADAYRERLRDAAGFQFVLPPIPMKNSQNSPIYYLYFAANHPLANKIARSVLKKYLSTRHG
jgi:three-Cys-motif partner protein